MIYNPLIIEPEYLSNFQPREMNNLEILGILALLSVADWIDVEFTKLDDDTFYNNKRLYFDSLELYLPPHDAIPSDIQDNYYIESLYMCGTERLVAVMIHYSNPDDRIFIRLN